MNPGGHANLSFAVLINHDWLCRMERMDPKDNIFLELFTNESETPQNMTESTNRHTKSMHTKFDS